MKLTEIRPVWSESSLSAWRKLGSLAIHLAHSEDSDQTGRIPRLICHRWTHTNFVGFVLSWLSSFNSYHVYKRIKMLYGPVFGVCDHVRLKPVCSGKEASWSHEIANIETRGIILSRQRRTKALIRLRGCAGWSAPLLFTYGINRFSHDVAHISLTIDWFLHCNETTYTVQTLKLIFTRLSILSWFVSSIYSVLLPLFLRSVWKPVLALWNLVNNLYLDWLFHRIHVISVIYNRQKCMMLKNFRIFR